MEVKVISQGGQNSIPFNNEMQGDEVQAVKKSNNGSDNLVVNISPNGVEHRAIREKDLQKAVNEVNKTLDKDKTHIEYEVYGKFKDITIRIVDNETKKVIKEMPPKNIIDMIAKFCEMAGLFLDQKV
jgi:flagellar protein FlaG